MLNLSNYFNNIFYYESYGFSLIVFNLFIYILSLSLLFFIFFMFNLNSFINLSNIKIFSSSYYFYMVIIFSLLSLVGMPPLLGFVGKFLIVIFINLKTQFFLFVLFVFLNLLMIYFYLQNFRFLIKKTNSTETSNSSYFIKQNIFVIKILNFLFFFLIFGIFFFDDFFLILSSFFFF